MHDALRYLDALSCSVCFLPAPSLLPALPLKLNRNSNPLSQALHVKGIHIKDNKEKHIAVALKVPIGTKLYIETFLGVDMKEDYRRASDRRLGDSMSSDLIPVNAPSYNVIRKDNVLENRGAAEAQHKLKF